MVPQAAEEHLAVLGCHRRLARPPPLGDAGHQGLLQGRQPPDTADTTQLSPSYLPEELLLARFVLVRRDSAQPPLSPIYDGPYQVLERSTHFFLLKMGDRTDKVSTLRLKRARTPADMEPAKPLRRGRPVAQGSARCAGVAPLRMRHLSVRRRRNSGDGRCR